MAADGDERLVPVFISGRAVFSGLCAPQKLVDTGLIARWMMGDSKMIGMTEAAKLTGKQRQTIHKAIKEGRISATRGESGEWRIDPAELFRVYPPASTVNDNQSDKVDAGLQRVDSGLQREVELLRERVREKNDIIDDLRQDRDHWRQQATALLTDRREPAATVGGKIELRTLARPRFLLALLAVMGLAVLVWLLQDRVAVLVDML